MKEYKRGFLEVTIFDDESADIRDGSGVVDIGRSDRVFVGLSLLGTTKLRLNKLLYDLIEAAEDYGVRCERGTRDEVEVEVEVAQKDRDTALSELRGLFGL